MSYNLIKIVLSYMRNLTNNLSVYVNRYTCGKNNMKKRGEERAM